MEDEELLDDPDKEARWLEDQNDPDNWFFIPDFGVAPLDVEFEGFKYPIVHPARRDYELASRVRDLVSLTRLMAKRRFRTMRELEVAYLAAAKLLETDTPATARQLAAFAYRWAMWHLERALMVDEKPARELASAAEVFLRYGLAQVPLVERGSAARKAASQAALAKRHREHREMKQQLREWHRAHGGDYPNLEATVNAAVEHQVPIAWSTAKTWIIEFRKEERAAGQSTNAD